MSRMTIAGATVFAAALTFGATAATAAEQTPGSEHPHKIVVTSAQVWSQVKEMSATQPTFLLYSSPAWCGPCRQAEPMLNKTAAEGQGKFTMVTITDKQVPFAGGSTPPGFKGWPSVYAFKDGQANTQSMTHPMSGEAAHKAWLKKWLGV